MPRFSKCLSDRHFLNIQRWRDKKPSVWLRGFVAFLAAPGLGQGRPATPVVRLKPQHLLPGPALETLDSAHSQGPQVPIFTSGTGKKKKTMRHYHPPPPPPLVSSSSPTPHDTTQVTQKAASTWRNTSVPIGAAAPSPLLPSLGPTMRPCAAPAARPGIWRRDGGNNRQIFKTEPREQSRSLCTKQPGAGSCRRARKVLPQRMRPAYRPRSGYPEFSTPVRGAFVNPFPGCSPGSAEREAGFHLLAVTRLIEKRNSRFPCFYRKHRSLK